ncbi:hypothetical protein [Salirhabdus salicampi]|uniref:hypothetical protein n=1 Tax=Salirhabdus salicampi TaxID=476102 RepID=UPI0020C54205|nr:hypothetical protein [Salirhabdus salicampi]MCP8615885.1 hypothetical protein [Salirhabdus salicampi]
MNLIGNVNAAYIRSLNDWNHHIDHFNQVKNTSLIKTFVQKLTMTEPITYQDIKDKIGNRNNNNTKELSIQLQDGTTVYLMLIKGGYIHYGIGGVYFHMNDEVFSQL